MALRLTTTPTISDATDDVSRAQLIGASARSALTAGDLDGYTKAVAQVGELENPHRRYQAELQLLELGLLIARSSDDATALATYMTVASLALDSLEREPSEPVLLNCAGIACYEVWALEAARGLFAAAARLDPSLPHLSRNRAEVARRSRGARSRRPLHSAIPGLARRAAAIARRAQPASGLTLSLCMIVRDEERMLGRCLAAAAPAVDEIVIVDTGSVDSTIEIARSFGAKVIEQPWTGSFAEARNASFDAATGDWLLYLDADEVLVETDLQRLRALTGHTWCEAMRLSETSFVGDIGDGSAVVNSALRIFRNRPEYRFSGALHEQIAATLPSWAPGRVAQTTVRIEHYGYLGDVRAAKDKSARNLTILREQMAAEAVPTAFMHFNLGSELAAVGDLRGGAQELSIAWEMLSDEGAIMTTEYVPRMIATLVRCLRIGGHPDQAVARATAGLELFGDCTDLVLEQAAAAFALGDHARAQALCRRCIELGDAPTTQGGLVGSGTYLPRLALARMALLRSDAATAVELLDWCLTHHPEYPGVAGPYAQARLRAGDDADAVVATLESHLNTLPVASRVELARALARAGGATASERQYRRVLEEVDERRANPARIALAEVLLGRGEFAQAASLAAAVPRDHPSAALACRIESCARIAGGELEAARAAARHAQDVGLSRHERAVLDAWIEAAGGGEPQSGLSVGSVPLLATLMEFMLRAGGGDQLGVLTALLERSRLPRRDQQQVIAEMHLRHGSHATAAATWLAVCAERPDARARLGLAQVAAAKRMYKNAAVFAADAVALDPSCAPARQLLTLLQRALESQPAPVAAGVDR